MESRNLLSRNTLTPSVTKKKSVNGSDRRKMISGILLIFTGEKSPTFERLLNATDAKKEPGIMKKAMIRPGTVRMRTCQLLLGNEREKKKRSRVIPNRYLV